MVAAEKLGVDEDGATSAAFISGSHGNLKVFKNVVGWMVIRLGVKFL